MRINRYILEELGFSHDEIQMFLRMISRASLPSAITKSINVNGTIRMVYHCESDELISYLDKKIEKMQRGNISENRVFLKKLKNTTAVKEAS